MSEVLGEWLEEHKIFHHCHNHEYEFIAIKDTDHVFVYPYGDTHEAPTKILVHDHLIKDLKDFTAAINTGLFYKIELKGIIADWQPPLFKDSNSKKEPKQPYIPKNLRIGG